MVSGECTQDHEITVEQSGLILAILFMPTIVSVENRPLAIRSDKMPAYSEITLPSGDVFIFKT